MQRVSYMMADRALTRGRGHGLRDPYLSSPGLPSETVDALRALGHEVKGRRYRR